MENAFFGAWRFGGPGPAGKRLAFAGIALLLVMPMAFSETLFERSFGEMGYESFFVDGANKSACTEIVFIFPGGIDFYDKAVYPIASIGLEAGPVKEGIFDANVFLNGSLVAGLGKGDFKCGLELCWERLFLPKGKLVDEENILQVCLGTGNTVARLGLDKVSKVGLYKAADFSGKDSFVVYAEKDALVIGEKTTVNIILHNGGSAASDVEIKFARPLAEDKNSFSVVEGKTYFEGSIKAGESAGISYIIKPRIAAYIALPPAIVYYKNEFGETESKFSNLVFLTIRQPDRLVEAFIVKDREQAFVGEDVGMKLAIRNLGNDPLYDIGVKLDSDAVQGKEMTLAELAPKETTYLDFTATSAEPGQFGVGCTITYADLNTEKEKCAETVVEFKSQEIGPAIYAGIALVIIALAAYVYIVKF